MDEKPTKEMIADQLKDLIIKTSSTSIAKESLNENTKLIEDLGFDSVSIINLVIIIEERFGIQIDDETLSLSIIGLFKNLIECVWSKLEVVDIC